MKAFASPRQREEMERRNTVQESQGEEVVFENA
jgi:hypothetical protein